MFELPRLAALSLLLAPGLGLAAAPDVLNVKRRPVFAFTQRPVVTRRGDRVTVAFTSKGYCDATVAVEDAEGRIIRHLVSGVLGENAPPPFRKDSLKQSIVWDGKNDKGEYVDDKDQLTVRVSLGLRPRFERTLFQSPYKRLGRGTILLAANAEGFYVYDVGGYETIRLYSHNGDYLRTVYPFPASKIEQVRMPRRTYPDGFSIPAKRAYFLATLLTGRESGGVESTMRISSEASSLTVRDGRMALAGLRVNRMATDGSSGGLNLWGPRVDGIPPQGRHPKQPHALAFSPDHKVLYLTAHTWLREMGWCPFRQGYWAHAVFRMTFDSDEKPAVFLGKENRRGSDAAHFDHPADVAVDKAGRIYVADQGNNRVQIFDAKGKLLRSLAVEAPARLRLHHKTQELYAFSWFMGRTPKTCPDQRVKPALRVFTAYPKLALRAAYPLPLRRYRTRTERNSVVGQQYQVALDSWVNPPRVLMVLDRGAYPELFELKTGGLEKIRDFLSDAKRSRIRLRPTAHARPRLYVDPRDGTPYLAEGDSGTGKSFSSLIRLDVERGRYRTLQLPFSASDMVISPEGHAYLRTGSVVGRFNLETWREVPFDYGEEQTASFSYDARSRRLIGALKLPSVKTQPHWHHGGMDVNARGDLLVTCFNPNSTKIARRKNVRHQVREAPVAYRPRVYPGRFMYGRELQIFDRRGHIKHRDLLKGQPEMVSGVGIDVDCNVYANFAVSMMWEGKPYWRRVGHRFDQVGTLAKFRPGRGRFSKAGGTPISLKDPPKRAMELDGFWVDGAEWLYPGVGRTQWGMDCSCWNSRMALDHFARSFAPEYDRFSVAVLDTAGNLMLRVGRYGNVDDGLPKGKASKNAPKRSSSSVQGGPPNQQTSGGNGGSRTAGAGSKEKRQGRSVWDDQVALFDGCYLATHTDRRLFIADPGNARILSVRLDYHATERVALKNVREE